MLTYAANTWQLFILVAIRWHCCCFVRWYWLGIHYLPGRETIPRLSFLQSTAEFCVDQGQRLRQWPQFTHSPWDVLLSQAHLPGHLMPGLLPAHRGSAFEVGSLHFQGRMSKMQTHRQLCCGGQTSVPGSAPGLQLLHQHIAWYLRKLICFCTMGFFVLFCLCFILFVKLSFPASRASLLSGHGNAPASLFTSSLKRKVFSSLQHRTCTQYVVQKILC